MSAPLVLARLASVAALASLARLAVAQAPAPRRLDLGPWLIADRAAEVALARSAAPRAISDSATVLVLARDGYVEAARGANGWTCVVMRGFVAPADDPTFWDPHIVQPHCYNEPAARTVLPAVLDNVRDLVAGASAADAQRHTRSRYAAHDYPSPAPGAMAWMLSPRQTFGANGASHWLPHVMFFHDRSLPPSTWGAGDNTTPVVDATAGDPSAPVLVILVPVRQWSDGSAAPPLVHAAH